MGEAAALASAYHGLLRVSVVKALTYRAQLVIWLLASLFPLIMMTVWLSVVDQVGPAAGWGRNDFISYYVAAAVLFHLTSGDLSWSWDSEMRSGDLSFRLLKPVSPVHHHIAMDIGLVSVTAALLVPVVLVLTAVLDSVRYPIGAGAFVLFLAAVVLGFAVSIAMSLAFAMGAFWSTQTAGLYWLWWGAGAFLSGWVAPVSVLPAPLQRAAQVLPFRSVLGFPLELLLGRLDPDQIMAGFAVGLSWLVLLTAAQRVLWRRGIVRYQAVGG